MILSGITAPFGWKPKFPDAIPKFGVHYLFIPHPFATDCIINNTVRLTCMS